MVVKGLLGGLFQIMLFSLLLLIPAGTWHWPRALIFLGAYGFLVIVSIIALARWAPASLQARLQPPVAKSQPVADRVVSLLLILSICAWFLFIPIDVFHLRLLPSPHFNISILGATLFLAGFGLLLTALFQNAFATPIVKDQSDRGHVLIDTGLYKRIRHPFYLGMLLLMAGIALWLESYASILTLPVVLVFLIARTFVEEKTLQETLPGYVAYMARVRYRLIPFIW